MLKGQLKKDMVAALKGGDRKRVDSLRFLISILDKKELSLPSGKMTEADEVAALKKELKNKQEAREMFAKASRNDLVDEVDFEIEVTEAYLPAEMTEEEIEKIVDQVIAGGADNFGAAMGQAMAKVAGRADGARVAAIVKKKYE